MCQCSQGWRHGFYNTLYLAQLYLSFVVPFIFPSPALPVASEFLLSIVGQSQVPGARGSRPSISALPVTSVYVQHRGRNTLTSSSVYFQPPLSDQKIVTDMAEHASGVPDPGFDLHANQSGILANVAIAMMVLSLVSVVLRMVSRKITRVALWWDDWLIFVALVRNLDLHTPRSLTPG
jgi:hypothetical protein